MSKRGEQQTELVESADFDHLRRVERVDLAGSCDELDARDAVDCHVALEHSVVLCSQHTTNENTLQLKT